MNYSITDLKEYHNIFEAKDVHSLLKKQEDYFASRPGETPVFKRYFLSDRHLVDIFPREDGAVSYIQQKPLDGAEVAVWVYSVSGAQVSKTPGVTEVEDSGIRHIWRAGVSSDAEGSAAQTAQILETYRDELCSGGLDMARNCVRTWFFVSDIDNNYSGMVKARREIFSDMGLTKDTHYISSTGIAGTPCRDGGIVMMDAWSTDGIEKCSQRYLYAPTHLNPTYEYGVTFERGTRIDYSGNAHLVISGTASIDNKGNVLHIGDIVGQTHRMLENVDALLSEGGGAFDDIKVILVYIRNTSDYAVVSEMFARKFPATPYIILHAPVCRPDWLIEMECIASFNL